MKCELYIEAVAKGDLKLAHRAGAFLDSVKPSVIGVEETQADIDRFMHLAETKDYEEKRISELFESYPASNSETVRLFALAENEFYKLLREKQETFNETGGKDGARIVGCDSDDFPQAEYRKAIEEYNARTTAFMKRILSMEPESAQMEAEKTYKKIPSISDSRELVEYYERRDAETAKSIKEQIEIEEDLAYKGGRKRGFVYFCDITHLGNYANLILRLNMFGPCIGCLPEKKCARY